MKIKINLKEIISELQKLGNSPNAIILKNHGVNNQIIGVSISNLKTFAKTLNRDNELANNLWLSEIHDLQVLATFLVNPNKIEKEMLEQWSKKLENHVITDSFTELVIKTPYANEKMVEWIKSSDEWISTVAWQLLSMMAMDKGLPDNKFEQYLEQIDKNINSAKNRTKYAMNGALISIGSRKGKLNQRALIIAKHIGEVKVDHLNTNCQTPNAVHYINNVMERNKK